MHTSVLSPRTFTLVLCVALAPFAVACKKKAPEPVQTASTEVRQTITVAQITPQSVNPGEAFQATIRGSGFAPGASVRIGGVTATNASVGDSSRIDASFGGVPAGTHDVVVTNPDGRSGTLRGGLTARSAQLSCAQFTVNFPFDSSTLTSATRQTLSSHQSCVQQAAGKVRVEGHCDERGTVEYNLALGQRRADAVKKAMTTGGVSSSRIETVSFGKERPVDRGSNETAWAKNRRAEIQVKE